MQGTEKVKRILVTGVVQGVGFRPFVFRLARRLGIKGFVRNLGDAGVEIVAAGEEEKVASLARAIREEKVRNARIDEVLILSVDDVQIPQGEFDDFTIVESGGIGASGTLPPDNAICDECISEMFDPSNLRRHLYPFTSCINCGSRLSTLKRIPYDRHNTSLAAFPMCADCTAEYENPRDRRLHYQGNTCSQCGPSYRLLDCEGHVLPARSPEEIAKITIAKLLEGRIVAIKGVTGTHLAGRTVGNEVVEKFRRDIGRPQKPFAVMAGSIEEVRCFARLSALEELELLSQARPIVLLEKLESADRIPISDLLSPGLRNIGVMLPYAGIHHLLFRFCNQPLLMTSANFPGQPMLTRNEEIIGKLRGVADFFLLHDLEIQNRCDDSVVRFVGGSRLIIRRSRGFAPTGIKIPLEVRQPVLALGSELSNTVCLLRGGDAYLSQYVGDTTHVETMEYQGKAIRTLLEMTNTKLEEVAFIAVDLNPAFEVGRHAQKLAAASGATLMRIQHHFAHAASLIGEHGPGPMVAIAIDGIGYGADGSPWGGEVIVIDHGKVERAAHLKPQRMPGADAAAYYPARMLAGILFDTMGTKVKEFLRPLSSSFKHGERELEVTVRQLERGFNVPWTTSCGRVLDAISALLGFCHHRTYDGEPAMKLEAASTDPDYEIPIVIRNGILDTTAIVERAAHLWSQGKEPGRIGASCQAAIATGLARMAIDVALSRRISTIGLTGGVAYNAAIHERIKDEVQSRGLRFVTNILLPCGDGSISFGQAILAALQGSICK